MVALASTLHPVLAVFFFLFGLGSAAGHVLPDTFPWSWNSSVSSHAACLCSSGPLLALFSGPPGSLALLWPSWLSGPPGHLALLGLWPSCYFELLYLASGLCACYFELLCLASGLCALFQAFVPCFRHSCLASGFLSGLYTFSLL
jgi:hypothetical protein